MTAAPPGVLALDLSLSTGWAYGGVRDLAPKFGTWKLPPYDLGHGRVFASYENELLEAFRIHQPTHVVFEAPFMTSAPRRANAEGVSKGGTNPEAMYGQLGLAAITEAAAYRWNLTCRKRAPTTVRARVIGRGQFSNRKEAKAAVMACCHAKGWMVPDDDCGDACLLWRYETWMLSPQGTRAAA